MKVLLGICSWGLGHATRSLPIIRRFVSDGDDVMVVSHGNALRLLKNELGESAQYAELEDYVPPVSINSRSLALDTLMNSPRFLLSMRREHRFVEKTCAELKPDIIFSDNRFGFYSLYTPSFFMTHQLRIMNPLDIRILESGTEKFNEWFMDRFRAVLVPDFRNNGLSGRLAHQLSVIDEDRISYIGAISDFKRTNVPEDIDIFATISGFEPFRSSLEKCVLEQLEGIGGKIVVSLGRPAENHIKDGISVRGLSSRQEQEEMLNRAKVVVARSGYSTLMDLYALGKRALLIPTDGQTEQEYLARYHMEQGNYYCVRQLDLDLKNQLGAVRQMKVVQSEHSSDRSVQNAIEVMTGTGIPG